MAAAFGACSCFMYGFFCFFSLVVMLLLLLRESETDV